MFGFLLDASAFWHLTRDPEAMKAWEHYGAEGRFHISEPTRAEVLYSAENAAQRDEMAGVGPRILGGTRWRESG